MRPDKVIDTPIDLDRLIQTALAELGMDANPTELAERVRRLDIGLPVEDEFAVVCSWLGKTRLLHKLDQQQIPLHSASKYQVPDALALFNADEVDRPVLIEIKSKAAIKLSFKADYYERLKRYANLMDLPLLIAWKYHNVWVLFEANHMKLARTNYNILFTDAIKESLLGILAGDVAYKIGNGAGLHFQARKIERVEKSSDEDETSELWQMVMESVTFTDREGQHRKDLSSDVKALFTTWDLESRDTISDTHVTTSFIATGEGVQFAHTALVRLLAWQNKQNETTNWRKQLRNPKVTKDVDDFEATLLRALDQKVVHCVMHLQPLTKPRFLRRYQTDKSLLPIDSIAPAATEI